MKREHLSRVASSRSSDTPRAKPEQETVAVARERVALRNLESEELRAAVGVERTRDELAAAEAERTKRRELIAVETERARLALEKDRAEHARQLQAEASQRRVAEHRRALELERERDRIERQRAVEAAARARAQWERRWCGWALGWLKEHTGGTDASNDAVVIVCDALRRFGPDDIDALIEINLNAALRSGLCEHVARWQIGLQERLRSGIVAEAGKIAAWKGRDAHERVLRAARAAAAAIDPCSPTLQQHVRDNARQEYQRILAEEQDAKEQAARAWEEDSRRRDWGSEFGRISIYLADFLDRDASAAERKQASAALEHLHAKMSPDGNPRDFRGAARRALDELSDQVRARLREERRGY